MTIGCVLNVRNTPCPLAVRVLVALVALLVHHGLWNTSTSTSTSPSILITTCPNTTDALTSNGVGGNSSGAMGKLQMPRMSTLQVDILRQLRFSVAAGYLHHHQRLIERAVQSIVH